MRIKPAIKRRANAIVLTCDGEIARLEDKMRWAEDKPAVYAHYQNKIGELRRQRQCALDLLRR